MERFRTLPTGSIEDRFVRSFVRREATRRHYGFGVVIIFFPEHLARYESEDPGPEWILLGDPSGRGAGSADDSPLRQRLVKP